MAEPSDLEQPSKPYVAIVGIGASAGGLDAFSRFFSAVPEKTGLAFVIVQHLDAKRESLLASILSRHTSMSVAQITDGTIICEDHVYVSPPGQLVGLQEDRLLLSDILPGQAEKPIDSFFMALAEQRGEEAIGIVLSGAGNDGTRGLDSLKRHGGLVMAQEPSSARFPSMPQSALSHDVAEIVLPPEELAGKLQALIAHRQTHHRPAAADATTTSVQSTILQLLHLHCGHDFTLYRPSTVQRRLERRMLLRSVSSASAYLDLLRASPDELDLLWQDLLIEVTRFFRDPEVFALLDEKVMPALLAAASPVQPVRIWVPGCSSGEEAYSLAMLLAEHRSRQRRPIKVQIFATDISERALLAARRGSYPSTCLADVPARLAERFLVQQDDVCSVRKELRDMIVFSAHNLVRDPPFSRLDLISCRNVLIYMTVTLQRQVLKMFDYALKPKAFLLLGGSETVGTLAERFEVADRPAKLFRSKAARGAPSGRTGYPPPGPIAGPVLPLPPAPPTSLRALVEAELLKGFAPVAVLVDTSFDILFVHGRTGRYLETASGRGSLNIVRMAKLELPFHLGSALREALAQNESVQRTGLRVHREQGWAYVDVTVTPLFNAPGLRLPVLLVVFEAAPGPETSGSPSSVDPKQMGHEEVIASLKNELHSTRQFLQATIEQLECSNEELTATNEELQSTNEELQSANEELETSKEELQSINEELMTVNSELEDKIKELSNLNNDMTNLLASIKVGTMFLDRELAIRGFTPLATKFVNLIPADVGRPFHHISSRIDYVDLLADTGAVLRSLIPIEKEVLTNDGMHYAVRILPYRTDRGAVDGVVITFIDITSQKQTQAELQRLALEAQIARACADSLIATVREPMLVLDDALLVVSASAAYCTRFGTSPSQTAGQSLGQLGHGVWSEPAFQAELLAQLARAGAGEDQPRRCESDALAELAPSVKAWVFSPQGHDHELVLLSIAPEG